MSVSAPPTATIELGPFTNGTNGANANSHSRHPSISTSEVRFHMDDTKVPLDEYDPATKGNRSPSVSLKRAISIAEHNYHHNQPGPHLRQLSPPAHLQDEEQQHGQEQWMAPSTPTETPITTPEMPQKTLVRRQSSGIEGPLAKYAQVKEIANLTTGLSEAMVQKQRAEHGFNETVEKQPPLIKIFALKFYNATALMITAAMVVAFALKEYINGGVIAVLLIVNACIAFREDIRAREALTQLMTKLQVMARVQRDGEWSEIPARELVPGDLVRLRTGDIGGADVVLLNGDLSLDLSALTGETALKAVKRSGVVFAGSVVKRGEANGIVVAIGAHTFFGQTAKLVQSSKPNQHIDRILTRIIAILMSLIIVLVAITLIVIGVQHDDLVAAIPLLLMVVVTALPVALPVMFNVSMALGSQELARRSVLVTRLNVLEDAAMMSLLYSDKTGTLTKNHLTIKAAVPLRKNTSEIEVLLTGALCSRKENSDPIDRACLESYATKIANKENDKVESTIYPDLDASKYEPLHFVPFDASNRRTEATVRYQRDGTPLILRASKGAVHTLCILSGLKPEDKEWQSIDRMVQEFANKGYRTLAIGYQLGAGADVASAASVSGNSGDSKFELVGLIALFDPPRTDSQRILERLSGLGIETKMLTGDAVGVACETGRALGMGTAFVNLEHEKAKVLAEWEKNETKIDMPQPHYPKQESAAETKAKEAEALEARVMEHLLDEHDPLKLNGFAQIFPADKHYIVKHTQKKGLICGMTGDGVNDAPSLKQAEVGCAVSNATDVAKGSASVILLNDGLSGVIDLVEVGRSVHRRVEVWVMNKVAKAAQHSVFILVAFLIIGRFPISALGVVVLLLLMDFVLVSLATDIQPAGAQPSTWNLARLTRIGLVVGLLGGGQIMTLILVTDYHNVFSRNQSETLAFEMMFLWGMLSVFAVREKSFFWSSRPSVIMGGIIFVETILVWIVCAAGVPGFDGIGWGWSSMILGFSIGCFVFNDIVKTLYIRLFERGYLDAPGFHTKPAATIAAAAKKEHIELSPAPPAGAAIDTQPATNKPHTTDINP